MGGKEYFLPGLCLSSERLALVFLCEGQYLDAPLAGPGQKSKYFFLPETFPYGGGYALLFLPRTVSSKVRSCGGEGSEASSRTYNVWEEALRGDSQIFVNGFFFPAGPLRLVLLFSSLPG